MITQQKSKYFAKQTEVGTNATPVNKEINPNTNADGGVYLKFIDGCASSLENTQNDPE